MASYVGEQGQHIQWDLLDICSTDTYVDPLLNGTYAIGQVLQNVHRREVPSDAARRRSSCRFARARASVVRAFCSISSGAVGVVASSQAEPCGTESSQNGVTLPVVAAVTQRLEVLVFGLTALAVGDDVIDMQDRARR